jgi:hypothetical protein
LRYWWSSPNDSVLHPLPNTVDDLLSHLRESGGRRHIKDFGDRVFPYASDSELLEIGSPKHEAVEWVGELLSNAHRTNTFGGARGLTRWLARVAQDLLCQPEVVVRIFWDEERWREKGWRHASPFYAHVLNLKGVEPREDGTYLIHPTEAHPGVRPRNSMGDEPYVLPANEALVFRSSTLSGRRLPLLEAAPHYMAYRVSSQESMAESYAQASPEDRTLRAQLARLRSGRWQESKRLANSRVAQILGSSLLEHTSYASIYASTTEYYLAWQHREALKTAMAVRNDILNTAVMGLLTPALDRAGPGASKLRIEPRGAPDGEAIDRAFEAYLRGETDLWGFHDSTHWWTEFDRRLQKHFESRVDLS